MTRPERASFRGQLLDHPVVVTAPDPEALAAIRAVLQGFVTSVPAAHAASYSIRRDERGLWLVDAGRTRVCEARTLADALLALEWRLVTDLLARGHHRRVHLHGAALSAPSGSTSVLILGASGTGKTTLTLALMGRDFLPFSDDAIFIEPRHLRLETFRRAFHVDPNARALVEKVVSPAVCRFDGMPPGYCAPSGWALHHAPVRTIVFPTLRPGAGPAITRLPLADAAARLLSLSSTLEPAPELALAVAARLTRHATSYALSAGDLEATTELVAEVTARTQA